MTNTDKERTDFEAPKIYDIFGDALNDIEWEIAVKAYRAGREAERAEAVTDAEAINADAVKDASEDGRGFWRSCSGCHELNEGHPTGRYSKALSCYLGLGCTECGGIGAVWDATDYSDFGRHLSEAPEPSFQARVKPWMMECFGAEISGDVVERCDRFIEETLEAVQSLGYPEERVAALQRYVYDRPAGEINQEVGGVMVTRSEKLNPVFDVVPQLNKAGEEVGKTVRAKYGASTTWMGKLLYRLNAGRHGGCPVLVFGITPKLIEDWNP